MTASNEPRNRLARRLKALRNEGLADSGITQDQLAEALRVSGSSISTWESSTNPRVPPEARLEAYARFFATQRSVATEPFRLLRLTDLTDQEKALRDQLYSELTGLRHQALEPTFGQAQPPSQTEGGLWRYPRAQNVTIVYAELPEERRRKIPYADPASPDYIKAYSISDLDALLELIARVNALNPSTHFKICSPAEATGDDYTADLIVLGGVDWNEVTRDVQDRVGLPVRQLARDQESDIGGFEVGEDKTFQRFEPTIQLIDKRATLVEDVAHVYFGPNPFNTERTITIFNGMYGRGVLGAVRALTDPTFRSRNEAYVKGLFDTAGTFSVVARVHIAVNGDPVTPDWSEPDVRLHVWPGETNELR